MRIQTTWFMRGTLSIVLTLLVLGSALPGFAQDNQSVSEQADPVAQLVGDASLERTLAFAPGEILVGFHRQGYTENQTDGVSAASLFTGLNIQATEALDLRGLDGATGDANVTGQLLRVAAGQEWVTIDQLRQNPAIAFALPNWLVYATESNPTVTAQPETPFLVNDPLYADRQWYLQRINASRAWALAASASGFNGQFSTVRVGIVDSGVDFEHPDLKERLLEGKNFVTPGEEPTDDCGHGTDVAGLIGAVSNNAIGISGVATQVEIAPYKVLHNVGGRCIGTISAVAAAIRAAADDGAKIINLSLESSSPSPVMEAAIKYAHAQGILLIAAVGNANSNAVAWPAAYAEVMGVAATGYADRRASYSNRGSEVEIAAPGGEVGSNRSLQILSTWPGNVYCRDISAPLIQSGYCTSEGTSMAAAVVSGGAALVMSVRPDLSAAGVRQLLRESATSLAEDATLVGSGRLDVHAALRQITSSDLQLAQWPMLNQQLRLGSMPYTVTVRLDNPSLEPIAWQTTLTNKPTWLTLQNAMSSTITSTTASTVTYSLAGTTRYGAPDRISLTISPTHLITGSYVVDLPVVGTRTDNTIIRQSLRVVVFIETQPHFYYFPLVLSQGKLESSVASAIGYQWETPADSGDRTTYGVGDDSDVGVTLPLTFTLRGKAYTDMRIFADGYVAFPGTSAGTALPTTCMPNLGEPNDAIYGWWADLDPGAAGAQISTFSSADRFVIEFDNIPTAADNPSVYRVSVQIVLHPDGNVGLNYRQTPDWQNAGRATVGIEAIDARFYNQVACKDDITELGLLPGAGQSFLFKAQEDIY